MNMIQLEQCIKEYGKDIYAFCSQITVDRQEAEELYQDVFLKAVELKEQIDYGQNPKSYLVSVALRIWKNKRRKYAWRNRIAGMEPLGGEITEAADRGDSIEEMLLKKEEREAVRRAVEGMEEKYRLPVYLYYTLQFPVGQIGKILKLPAGTVKSRLHKARKLLKKELEVVLDEIG